MTQRKKTPPLFYPDLYVERDGVTLLYQLWGAQGPGGLVSIGDQRTASRQELIEQRIALARGKRNAKS